MKKIFVFGLLLQSFLFFGQANQELMKINHKPISTSEFERLYTKNLNLVQDPSQRDIDNYLKLFTDYKLELEDAYTSKYDTMPRFKRELGQYRNELAKKYLSDTDIIDKLVKEAYERMKTDVHVAHILIQVPQDAPAKDTLKAYNKIMKIYKKAKAGQDFTTLAKQYSQDPSVKENGGDLDYINIFHTVYPFESAAYNTKVGEVSKPFRTRFGYHIVKVIDKRPALGNVEVAHILTSDRKKIKVKQPKDNAETRINQIYQKLQKGEDTFENLARKFSDDSNTAKRGGKLRMFGIRQMIPEFEKQAFALKKPGDYSKPFHTRFGWHIVKLIKKYPVPPFEDVKGMLKAKVNRDGRSKLGKQKLLKRIAKEFPIVMKTNLKDVYPYITRDFFENKWQIPQGNFKNKVFFTINGNQEVTVDDFFKYIYRRQQKNKENYKRKESHIQKLFEGFKKSKLLDYYDKHLEELYPDFAAIVKEYKEGLLLFNIKSDKVWNKAIKDTLGLESFFNQNKAKYKLPERYKILLAQVNDKKSAKKIMKLLKKGKSQEDIKKHIKGKGLIFKKKTYLATDKFVAKHDLKDKEVVKYKDGNQYVILYLEDVEPAKIPKLDEVKGKVTNDYQNYLEQEWVKELKQKFPVEINQKTWQKIRAKYKK